MTTISNFMSTPRAVAVSLAVVLVPSLMVVMVLSFDAHEGAGRVAAGCFRFEATHLNMKRMLASPEDKTKELNQDDPRSESRCPHLKNIWTAALPPRTELCRQSST